MNERCTSTTWLRVAVLMGAWMLGVSLAWAGPWVSTPSSVERDGTVRVTGGGLAPARSVVVAVVNASGSAYHLVETDGQGAFVINLPYLPGDGLRVEVWDPAGGAAAPVVTAPLAVSGPDGM